MGTRRSNKRHFDSQIWRPCYKIETFPFCRPRPGYGKTCQNFATAWGYNLEPFWHFPPHPPIKILVAPSVFYSDREALYCVRLGRGTGSVQNFNWGGFGGRQKGSILVPQPVRFPGVGLALEQSVARDAAQHVAHIGIARFNAGTVPRRLRNPIMCHITTTVGVFLLWVATLGLFLAFHRDMAPLVTYADSKGDRVALRHHSLKPIPANCPYWSARLGSNTWRS